MGPRKGLPTGHQERLEVLLRTLLRMEGCPIRGLREEIKRKGTRPEQARDAQVAVHWSGAGVQNYQEVDIAIRRGSAIAIGQKGWKVSPSRGRRWVAGIGSGGTGQGG